MTDPMNVVVTRDAPLRGIHETATRPPTVSATIQYGAPTLHVPAVTGAGSRHADTPSEVTTAAVAARSAQQGASSAGCQLPEDAFAVMASLHNAIVRDDAVEARGVLVSHPLLRDQVMPHGCNLAQWVTDVLLHFDDHGSIPDDREERVRFSFFSNPIHHHNEERYLQVPSTPLARAIEVGARNVVKVLLDLGAKAEPSPEALLSRAINHLYENKIFVYRAVHREESYPTIDTDSATDRRASDWLGILADLLTTFGRTAGRLSPIDANPLFVLRVTSLCRARCSLGLSEPSTAFSDSETLERLRVALGLLFAAGYSPDEIMSETPQEHRFTGYHNRDDYKEDGLQDPGNESGSGPAWPVLSSERTTEHRRACQTMTEREGALLTRNQWSCQIYDGGNGAKKLRDDITATILAAYAQIPSA